MPGGRRHSISIQHIASVPDGTADSKAPVVVAKVPCGTFAIRADGREAGSYTALAFPVSKKEAPVLRYREPSRRNYFR